MRYPRLISHQFIIKRFECRHSFFKKVLHFNAAFLANKKIHHPLTVTNYMSFFPRFSCLGRNKSLCFLTSKPRSVIRRFKLARIALRELVYFVRIQGIQRSTW